MGDYLNMANNNKANPAKGTAANENYARELMQLFTLGLGQLNLNGTPVLDSQENQSPTYSQADVTNVARMLTGWTYPTAPGATAKINNRPIISARCTRSKAEHDTGAKTIFGEYPDTRRANRRSQDLAITARQPHEAEDHGPVYLAATHPAPGDQQSQRRLHPTRGASVSG